MSESACEMGDLVVASNETEAPIAEARGPADGARAAATEPTTPEPKPEVPAPAQPAKPEVPAPAQPEPEVPAPAPPKPEVPAPTPPEPKPEVPAPPKPEVPAPTPPEPKPEVPAPPRPEVPAPPKPEVPGPPAKPEVHEPPARPEVFEPSTRPEVFEPSTRPEVPEPSARPEVPAPAQPSPSPPSITGVAPDHGPRSGGTIVTVRGEAFADGCKVLLGGVEATTTRESETCLRVETPPRAAKGLVELRVVNPDEQVAIYEEDFRYDPAPTIAGTEPSCVSTEGGAVLTVLGADFITGCGVRIDGMLVPASWVNAGRVEAVVKKHDAGEVDLVVENPDGQRATRERAVRFAAPPHLGAITPAAGFTAGGAEVRLDGRGFEPGCTVLVGGTPVAALTVVSDTELRFTAPPHGEVEVCDVVVVNPSGLADRRPLAFAYTKAPPRVASIAPDRGANAGGTELVLHGQHFDPGAAVFICGIAASVTWKGPGELAVVSPAVARDGLVDVRVVNGDDQAHTVEKAFLYVAPLPEPKLREVSPARGALGGGLKVALLGEDFAEGVVVRFAGVPAVVRFLTGKELEVTTPAHTVAGETAVEVVNPDGAVSVLEAAFTYEAGPAPEITGISPTSGPTTGGTRVLIEGKNFSSELRVYVGRELPKDVVRKSATELQIVTMPRKQAGVVDVEVMVPGAPRAIMKNGFRYDAVPAPIITGVSPSAGGVGGGTEMTISGKNFLKETVVRVDGKAPRAVKLVDAGTLELKTPPGDAGKMVDVTVTNPDGREAVQKRAFLYDPRYKS